MQAMCQPGADAILLNVATTNLTALAETLDSLRTRGGQ